MQYMVSPQTHYLVTAARKPSDLIRTNCNDSLVCFGGGLQECAAWRRCIRVVAHRVLCYTLALLSCVLIPVTHILVPKSTCIQQLTCLKHTSRKESIEFIHFPYQ